MSGAGSFSDSILLHIPSMAWLMILMGGSLLTGTRDMDLGQKIRNLEDTVRVPKY